ncbi:hypothetical protein L218DRAFT_964691 [Marasmius fiardii PR-910]|nr:hypothetical protein L218DRAFT_964691 [Marasmius fiardii PR-910]
MVKGSGKSSASSATRKKHAQKQAKKNAGPGDLPAEPPAKVTKEKKEKGKKKEPRPKVYIPPVKPAPVQPDPLETTGLAHQLPPELLVSLRSLSKKAVVTKVKGLEDLQYGWVDKVLKRESSENEYVLVDMLPVWLHHLPSLFMHSSRRIRLLTATLHDSFFQIPAVKDRIIFSLTEALDEAQVSSIVGSWCIAVHDIDRLVTNAAVESWRKLISTLGDDKLTGVLSSLQAFVHRAALDPSGTYTYLNPPAPTAPPPPASKKINAASRANGSRSSTPDVETRSKAEDVEENEQDRMARIRVGAFGSVGWLLDNHKAISTSVSFFDSPALWSALHHAEVCPFWDGGSSFGFGQPSVRKSAWMLLQALLRALKGVAVDQQTLLLTLSTAVLRSAWVEPDITVQQIMWQPLLLFLKEYPQAWKVEAENQSDESDNEEDVEPTRQPRSSLPYAEFLQFLQLGCGGSPIQGYQTIVIILSTIPSEILALPSLDSFFTSFWAAIDGRALSSLQRSAASAQFLSALLECLVFLVKRSWRDKENVTVGNLQSLFPHALSPTEVDGSVKILVNRQLERVWAELASSSLQVKTKVASKQLFGTLEELRKIDIELWQSAWEALSNSIKESSTKAPQLVCSVFSLFLKAEEVKLREAARELLRDIVGQALHQYQAFLGTPQKSDTQQKAKPLTEFVVSAFKTLGEELFHDPFFSKSIDDLATTNAYALLFVSESTPSFLLAYLSSNLIAEEKRQVCWQHLLKEISFHPDVLAPNLSRILEALDTHESLHNLRPRADELDGLVGRFLVETLGGGVGHVSLLKRILKNPRPLLSGSGCIALVQSLASSFSLQVDNVLHEEDVSVNSFDVVLDFLAIVLQGERGGDSNLVLNVLPDIFVFSHLVPKFQESSSSSALNTARTIWEEWRKAGGDQLAVNTQIVERLRTILMDVDSRSLPEHIIHASRSLQSIDPLTELLPSEVDFNSLLEKLASDPIHHSLAVFEPLVPPPSMFLEELSSSSPSFDSHGHSLYARLVTALTHIVVEDRQTAKRNVWILRHLFAFSIYAEDLINFPAGQSPVFSRAAIDFDLGELVPKVHQITTYLLFTSGDETKRALEVLTGKSNVQTTGLVKFIVNVIKISQATETIREFRVLCRVLQHVFDDVERDEAEQWVAFARSIERGAPNTSIAILSFINAFGSEPPRLERYRNELAASLMGVRASNAETEGLMILRKLAAVAPPVDSDVVFLPQQRAVNVIKTCQQWVTSDDDVVGEDLESVMTLVFAHLAPILQHVAGSHWAFVFDVVENNFENSEMSDESTLVTLARTLRLVMLIQDLAATNKALQSVILIAVRNLAGSQLSTFHELPENLPSNLVDHESLPKMCHLLSDPSVDVQKMAYKLLQQVAKKRMEHLVVEAGMDMEDKFKAELPHELLVALQQQSSDFNLGEIDQEQIMFGYLLGWMLLFDLFIDTSMKVRSGYIEQLRSLGIISTCFIPTVFTLLGLDRGGVVKAFKLNVWEVEEYYVAHYEPGEPFSLPVLAAHLYYRALLTVPSIIHSWVLDCKDVQLSTAIGLYTSTHFSPAIIHAELDHVKGATDLTGDENLTIKVASSVNEVAAAYSVDEHQLEIKIRIPNDWPLHRIEIRDTKMVGVDEKRWRAWILAVQQTMWAQNGRIADGLALFKKNVTLHFEGQVECAICYSIISVMDGSLPKKPCRTCKNRFHSGCLFKWFKTSHSSSCPLCRSDILHQ